MRRSARSINVCERTDGLWGLPPELMCRVQRGKTWYSGSVGVYCRRTRVKMEILDKVIPVNPTAAEILGERCYSSLKAIPEPVDIVDIFRLAEAVPPIVEEAIQIGAKVVWLQLGVINYEAAQQAREAGLATFRCKKGRFGVLGGAPAGRATESYRGLRGFPGSAPQLAAACRFSPRPLPKPDPCSSDCPRSLPVQPIVRSPAARDTDCGSNHGGASKH